MAFSTTSIINRITKSNLLQDSFWALIGSVVCKGLSLLAGILVAKFLGTEMFGQYGVIKGTLLNIAIFSTLGLGYTGTRFIAKHIDYNVSHIIRIIYKVSIITSAFMAILVYVFATQIAIFIKAPTLVPDLKLTAIIIIFNAVNTAQIGILSGFKSFKKIAQNNLYAGIVTFLLSGILSFFYTLDGALWALLISTCFNLIINHSTVKWHEKQLSAKPHTNPVKTKEIISFSIPIALQESMYTIVSFLSSYLLIYYAGYGELGIYSAATQWTATILFIPGVMKNVILSYFSSSESANRMELRNKMIIINGLSTFIPWVIISISSGVIASFYGNTYTNLYIVLIISCMQAIFSSITGVILYELISEGKTWTTFGLRLLRDCTILCLIWFCLSHFREIQGSIISSCVYTFVAGLFMSSLLFFYKIKKNN